MLSGRIVNVNVPIGSKSCSRNLKIRNEQQLEYKIQRLLVNFAVLSSPIFFMYEDSSLKY